MEVANEIMKGVIQVLMVPVKKQLDYLISYKKYVEDMHTKMKDLDAARVGVESQRKQNRERRLEVPAQVSPWLIEVEQMNAKVADFPSEVAGCLELKSRHKLGRNAFKIFKEIESILGRCPEIRGTEAQIPLGRIDSTIASTSTPSSDDNDFQSRGHTFTEALKALGPDHSSHMVALCGMGGVGKTTMMKKLKEVVVEKKMFNQYVEAVIGEKMDPIAFQQAVAEYLGIELTETTKPARTDKLRTWFANNSDRGKKKFLVILDDVWKSVDLEDIGLSRLPNQGVDFKVLITSRDQAVCTEMGVKGDSVIKVSVLEEAEAQSLFRQFLEPFGDDVDPELHAIGEEIVRKCCGLPIAIKTMACTLRSKSKDTWKNALSRLQHHDINTVAPTVFKTSYDNIQDEVTEATFLLCGLFPEDFNIRTEDLLRYGWGLNLFKGLVAIREARYRLNACIERLIHTNLLIESEEVGCVKMHDLVRAFVLDMFSKVEHASIVNHGSKPGWPETESDVSASCKRISLTCNGMTEFPSDLKFPNLSILKLMHGDESLRFRQGFYEEMVKLQVISYDYMMYPLLSSSLECSTNLRVLRLHKCLLAFDLSSIGNLPNLEVLSFANSGIKCLPSTIGKLKKLRLLDVTGCSGLRIDNCLFKKLVKLEELYANAKVDYEDEGFITFTGDNCNEVAERWKNLCVLEFEFFENDAQLTNLSVEKLELFNISVGCSLDGDLVENMDSCGNMLQLVTKKGGLLKYRINELFEKTNELHLSVDDIKDLEDIVVNPSLGPQSSSFRSMRVLVVSECEELRYLFTLGVAKVLSNVEHLEVFDCPVMKELIHIESGGEERVTLPNLKNLYLRGLPELSGLCQNVNITALPQLVEMNIEGIPNITGIYSKDKLATSCLLRGEVVIPKLEKLDISKMENLKEIWPCDFRTSEEVIKLRKIKVSNCVNLVNLFPYNNPMPLLLHLEELEVWNCGSIEVLFNIDLDCVAASDKDNISLKRINVSGCAKLMELFPFNPMPLLYHLEELKVNKCGSIEALFNIDMDCVAASEKDSISLKRINVSGCAKLMDLFPFNPMLLLYHLEELKVNKCGSIEALFNIDMDCVAASEKDSISLRRIDVSSCDKLVHLFPCNPMPLLHHLEKLTVERCGSIEALFNIDLDCVGETGEGGSSSLRSIKVDGSEKLQEVWRIKCANHSLIPIHGFQAVESISIKKCKKFRNVFAPTTTNFDLGALIHLDISDSGEIERKHGSVESSQGQENTLFPTYLNYSFHNLRNLVLIGYRGLEMIFEIKSTPTSQDNQQRILPYLEELDIRRMERLSHVWKCNWNEFLILHSKLSESPFHNLTTISVRECHSIKYLFSPLMAKLLSNLKRIEIGVCDRMEEVVSHRDDEDENDEHMTSISTHTSTTLFPRLKSFNLYSLPKLRCIGGGGAKFSRVDGASWTLCEYPREIYIRWCYALSSAIPCDAAGQMQNLQVLKIEYCHGMKKVFETQGINKSVINLKLPNLKKLEISGCDLLEHIFTFSTFETLEQLEKLSISYSKAVKAIVVKEEEETTTESSFKAPVVKFPRLKCIRLENLPEVVGFFLGTNIGFQLPSLDEVTIDGCPQMKVFTAGGSTAPQLKYVRTRLGKHTPEPGFNSRLTTTTTRLHQESPCPSLESRSSSCPAATTSEEINLWSFHNLIKLDVANDSCFKKIIPSNELLQLQKLEKIEVRHCDLVEEVFEALEAGTSSSGFIGSQKNVVKLPNLAQVGLMELPSLRHIWKSNRCTVFEFPNLTRVSIKGCHKFEHVFSSSMVGSLLQLQELQISDCKNMEEVFVQDRNIFVEEEDSDGKTNEIVFPRLKFLKLDKLNCLKGFCLGKEDFSFPLLDTLTIHQCPAIATFTTGNSSAPELKGIHTSFGSYYVKEDINSFIKIKLEVHKLREQIITMERSQTEKERLYLETQNELLRRQAESELRQMERQIAEFFKQFGSSGNPPNNP